MGHPGRKEHILAILKHKTSKNLSYGDVFDYYTYRHREDSETGHYEPILDEFGQMQQRENCAVIALDPYGRDADPAQWAAACYKTNQAHHKNNKPSDRKNHEYIISHPESDRDKMSMEDLLAEGKAFVRANLKGYDAIIAVHRDTDNDHIHITINSCRSLERDEESWMMKNDDGTTMRCETMAGGKHQNSPEFQHHCNDWLLVYSKDHGLTLEDNNAKAKQHKAERYAEKNLELKRLLLSTAEISHSIRDFQHRLATEHQIQLIVRGKTISVLPPDRKKAIRLRTLNLDAAELLRTIGITNREFSPDTARQELEQQEAQSQTSQDSRWLRDCRTKNNQAAVALLQAAERILTESALHNGNYDLQDITSLKQVIGKITYAQRDLKTELDKLTRIADRWQSALNSKDPQQQEKGLRYIQRCGFDPNSQADFSELVSMQKLAAVQIEHLAMQQAALIQIAPTEPKPEERPLSELEQSTLDITSAQIIDPEDGRVEPRVAPEPQIQQGTWQNSASTGSLGSRKSTAFHWWDDTYKLARKYLYGTKNDPPQPERAYVLMKQSAAAGNGFALHDLGQMHRTGLGCEKNPELAEKFYFRALTAFLVEEKRLQTDAPDTADYLQYRIGKMYLRGLGTAQNYEQAASWLKLASSKNPYAAYTLAGLYRRGQGVEPNNETALELYTTAATAKPKNTPYAAYELGNMYRQGIGTQPDPEIADQWYAQAYQGFQALETDTLDDTLLYRMGQMNYKALGTEQNIPLAISYFEKAAERKNTNALYGLGLIFLDENLPQYDPPKGIEYMSQAADLGNAFAQYRLGKLYLTGEHIKADIHEAIRLFSAAAEQGNDMARYQLGKLLYNGIALRQNTQQAIRYLEPAAQNGNSYAMCLLGKILLTEKSVIDPKRGLDYLRRAAEMGNDSAQYHLGKTLYYSRQPQYHAEAIHNLQLATDRGNSYAMALLGKIIIMEGSEKDIRYGIDLMLKGRSRTDTDAKDLLNQIHENRKKFGEIAYHYQQLANRHIYNEKEQQEAQRFRAMWHKQLEAERYLKQQLLKQRWYSKTAPDWFATDSTKEENRTHAAPDRKEKSEERTL